MALRKKHRDAIRAIIATSRPIETAPRDGTVIELLSSPDGQNWYGNLGFWREGWHPVDPSKPIFPFVINYGSRPEPRRWRPADAAPTG